MYHKEDWRKPGAWVILLTVVLLMALYGAVFGAIWMISIGEMTIREAPAGINFLVIVVLPMYASAFLSCRSQRAETTVMAMIMGTLVAQAISGVWLIWGLSLVPWDGVEHFYAAGAVITCVASTILRLIIGLNSKGLISWLESKELTKNC